MIIRRILGKHIQVGLNEHLDVIMLRHMLLTQVTLFPRWVTTLNVRSSKRDLIWHTQIFHQNYVSVTCNDIFAFVKTHSASKVPDTPLVTHVTPCTLHVHPMYTPFTLYYYDILTLHRQDVQSLWGTRRDVTVPDRPRARCKPRIA